MDDRLEATTVSKRATSEASDQRSERNAFKEIIIINKDPQYLFRDPLKELYRDPLKELYRGLGSLL